MKVNAMRRAEKFEQAMKSKNRKERAIEIKEGDAEKIS
jgi:hypothetical protein